MLSQLYYLVRSRQDGRHLVARPPMADRSSDPASSQSEPTYLLVFPEHADALSYLNTHAQEAAPQFAVESITSSQLASTLKRWGFSGIGVVRDPLLPRIEFLIHE